MSKDMQIAYFRELHHTNQCELVFPLKITSATAETILDQEIRSVRQITDNVQSLIEHTKNKINKILKTKSDLDTEITVTITQNGTQVTDSNTCKHFIKEARNAVLIICNDHYEIVMNAPLIQSVTLPFMLYVDYMVQPVRYKAIYMDKKLSEYKWYTSPDKSSWTEVGYAFKYKPTAEKLGHFLKFCWIPRNNHTNGPIYEIISETPIENMSSVPACPFQKRHEYTQTRLKQKEIRVVSYNTLSNRYSETNSQFPYCSPQAISIDYRKQLILKELTGYNADIMCLQEVDHSIFLNYFKPKLAKNFKAVYHKKGNRIPEGLACFYNNERFKALEVKQLVISAEVRTNSLFRRKWNLIKQSDSLKECIIKQPTSLQLTILKSLELNEIIIVANTHLYYHSEANNIRLLQTSIALDYIAHVFNKYKRTNKQSRVSVLFCGDFNSVPTSAVYDFFTRGTLQHTFEIEKETPIRNICLNHPFNFVSAYGTPKYTNYTQDFKGCLDYIFYDKNSFSVIDCVPLPEEAVLAEKTALPNEVFPSDHIALVANLRLL